MILALLVLPILVVSANPFHKYPYVFLLDVGNEELEKVNTEQIRLSSPGGSVALRYPAIGNGDDIAHVRVSGIDFGTDLKANIVDGGPGYKYVVIVLMGKPVAYDAIITIQTVPNIVSDDSIQTLEDNSSGNSNEDGSSTYQVSEEDQNNSAEDLTDSSDSEEAIQVGRNDKNGELTQEKDVRINQPPAERYTSDDDYSHSDNNQPAIADQSLYSQYGALKPDLYNGVEVYPQESIRENSEPASADQSYDARSVNTEEIYDDYEENDSRRYIDTNNNFIDTNDASAVAY
ncbi:Uncharacterized protein OBRU01_13398 [Operophtera brumata]|uniref:Uncharacterized protein n=1 Tax=Operophtera brumata TaxID=104452 RepID=A0A0L7L8A7_OPEBR|nr:Uncharacterized protein OBRU01_13398 [Operophtera brumata]